METYNEYSELAQRVWPGIQVDDVDYRKTSSISRTKSQNLNVSNIVLQLSLPNQLKLGVKSRMKM